MEYEMATDLIGQDVKVGDIITWSNSSRYQDTSLQMVVKFTPKMMLCTGRNKVNQTASYLVVTEQVKNNNPEKYQELKNKAVESGMVEGENQKTPELKKNRYYCISLTFLGKNQTRVNEDKNYRNFQLNIHVYEDGVLVGEKEPSRVNTSKNIWEHKYPVSREYKKDTEKGFGQISTGKFQLGDSYCSSGRASAFRLPAKVVKKLIGYVPETSITTSLVDGKVVLDLFTDADILLNIHNTHGGGSKNSLARALNL